MERKILYGDAREQLRTLPAASVQMIVTSPPFFGVRDYATEPQVWGGSPDCAHVWTPDSNAHHAFRDARHAGKHATWGKGTAEVFHPTPGSSCADCGAWLGELGSERIADCLAWANGGACSICYVCHIRMVARELHRVLRRDGTFWLNLGDSYSTYAGNRGGASIIRAHDSKRQRVPSGYGLSALGLPNKNLIGIPWRVALALQADGWILRSDNIWSKVAPMPESVTDRPTKSHEYVFLFSKDRRYFYNEDEALEPASHHPDTVARNGQAHATDRIGTAALRGTDHGQSGQGAVDRTSLTARRRRTVWTLTPSPSKVAHYAMFPEELPEICIRLGSRPGDVVLDPFLGSGTTARVAERLGRGWIGIELNQASVDLATQRTAQLGLFRAEGFAELRVEAPAAALL